MYLTELLQPIVAAGCIFLTRDTGRFLLAHRSGEGDMPDTWAGWGGKAKDGEDAQATVRREVKEETGYSHTMRLIPLLVFRSSRLHYANFLAVVEHEFRPRLDDENRGYVWCEFGDWPHPLHFGLKALFADRHSMQRIQLALRQQSDRPPASPR
jgi:8-oxo-dGTP pyrophosphatase MutT (NUDIX family)